MNGLAWCALASVASALATFLIKLSHTAGEGWSAARLAFLAGACATYGLGFVFYSIALQKMPMSLTYPLMTAMTMCVVAALGALALGEALTAPRIAGMLLIAAGAFVLTR